MGVKKNKGVKKTKDRSINYVTARRAENTVYRNYIMNYTIQMFMDYAAIALNQEYGFSGERLGRFSAKMTRVANTFSKEICDEVEESKKDKFHPSSFMVTSDKLEELVKKAWGDKYEPHDERYNWVTK